MSGPTNNDKTTTEDPPPVRKAIYAVHGTNPTFLIEKVLRSRIYDSLYWKEHCFALSAETIIDQAVDLQCIGGTYGVQKPTEFLSLVLKLLQLQPSRGIILAYLEPKEFKYLRALAAFYIRLVYPSVQIYELLEPMLQDYRKLRFRNMDGSYRLTHMDEFIDDLLTQERVCDTILPRLTKRELLEEREGLEPRISLLEDALLDDEGGSGDDSEDEEHRERQDRWKQKLRKRKELREKKAAVARLQDEQTDRTHEDERIDQEEDGYASQEGSDDEARGQRHISRSPSRSVSPDRSDAGGRFVSRSPSRSASPGAEEGGGYVSRSPSRSPDRD